MNASLSLAIIESSNAAGYGDRIATGAHSLRVSPETDGMKIETSGSGGGTLQPAPKVELLDAYGSIMVGDRARQISIETFVEKQGQNGASSAIPATISGGIARRVDNATGIATFDALNLRGRPGSGPHEIGLRATVDVVSAGISARQRFIDAKAPLMGWVKACSERTFEYDGVCTPCLQILC